MSTGGPSRILHCKLSALLQYTNGVKLPDRAEAQGQHLPASTSLGQDTGKSACSR